MWPTKQDKFKRMAATIIKTNAQPADLFKAQYKRGRKAKVWKAFKKQ